MQLLSSSIGNTFEKDIVYAHTPYNTVVSQKSPQAADLPPTAQPIMYSNDNQTMVPTYTVLPTITSYNTNLNSTNNHQQQLNMNNLIASANANTIGNETKNFTFDPTFMTTAQNNSCYNQTNNIININSNNSSSDQNVINVTEISQNNSNTSATQLQQNAFIIPNINNMETTKISLNGQSNIVMVNGEMYTHNLLTPSTNRSSSSSPTSLNSLIMVDSNTTSPATATTSSEIGNLTPPATEIRTTDEKEEKPKVKRTPKRKIKELDGDDDNNNNGDNDDNDDDDDDDDDVGPSTSKEALRRKSAKKSATNVDNANVMTLPNGRIKCTLCDKEFSRICYFTQHNKSFHSGEYPYRCSKCGKRYQDFDLYNDHINRHGTDEKPHKCEYCPKQFYHKTDLKRHVDGIHIGNKQYTCEICNKGFCRNDHMRKHMETHSRSRATGTRKPRTKTKQAAASSTEEAAEPTPSTSAAALAAPTAPTNGTTTVLLSEIQLPATSETVPPAVVSIEVQLPAMPEAQRPMEVDNAILQQELNMILDQPLDGDNAAKSMSRDDAGNLQ